MHFGINTSYKIEMKHKIISLALIFSMTLCMFTACGKEIAIL